MLLLNIFFLFYFYPFLYSYPELQAIYLSIVFLDDLIDNNIDNPTNIIDKAPKYGLKLTSKLVNLPKSIDKTFTIISINAAIKITILNFFILNFFYNI